MEINWVFCYLRFVSCSLSKLLSQSGSVLATVHYNFVCSGYYYRLISAVDSYFIPLSAISLFGIGGDVMKWVKCPSHLHIGNSSSLIPHPECHCAPI